MTTVVTHVSMFIAGLWILLTVLPGPGNWLLNAIGNVTAWPVVIASEVL